MINFPSIRFNVSTRVIPWFTRFTSRDIWPRFSSGTKTAWTRFQMRLHQLPGEGPEGDELEQARLDSLLPGLLTALLADRATEP